MLVCLGKLNYFLISRCSNTWLLWSPWRRGLLSLIWNAQAFALGSADWVWRCQLETSMLLQSCSVRRDAPDFLPCLDHKAHNYNSGDSCFYGEGFLLCLVYHGGATKRRPCVCFDMKMTTTTWNSDGLVYIPTDVYMLSLCWRGTFPKCNSKYHSDQTDWSHFACWTELQTVVRPVLTEVDEIGEKSPCNSLLCREWDYCLLHMKGVPGSLWQEANYPKCHSRGGMCCHHGSGLSPFL